MEFWSLQAPPSRQHHSQRNLLLAIGLDEKHYVPRPQETLIHQSHYKMDHMFGTLLVSIQNRELSLMLYKMHGQTTSEGNTNRKNKNQKQLAQVKHS